MSNQSTCEGDSIELDAKTFAVLEELAARDGCDVEQALHALLTEFVASPRGRALDDQDDPDHEAAVAQTKAEIAAHDEFDRVARVARRRACLN